MNYIISDAILQKFLDFEAKEPLLSTNNQKYVTLTNKFPEMFKLYKNHISTFWTLEEIKFTKDLDHWKLLTSDEKHFIKHILAFFASFDGIVNENLALNFYTEIQHPEPRAFLSVQMMMETIHGETYAAMINIFAESEEEKAKLFNAVHNYPSIIKMKSWALKWTQKSYPYHFRVLAFSILEGLMFSGQFCSIFWLKKRGLMSEGLCHANELIARDEGLHFDFAKCCVSVLENKVPEEIVLKIFLEAVELEKEFITESLPCSLLGMNCTDMNQYIEYVCDYSLSELGYNKYFKVSNPFPWMDLLSAGTKTNFFERRVADYSKSGLTETIESLEGLQSQNVLYDESGILLEF